MYSGVIDEQDAKIVGGERRGNLEISIAGGEGDSISIAGGEGDSISMAGREGVSREYRMNKFRKRQSTSRCYN